MVPFMGSGAMHVWMEVSEFSHGSVTPALGFAVSVVGAFLGLRCMTRARATGGWARRRWLLLAGVSLGLGCVWVGHFIDMLGFGVAGQTVRYGVPETLASALLVVAVMCAGLFVTGSGAQVRQLVLGGLLVGLGIASMHYAAMAAVRMPGAVSYQPAWLLASAAVAVAGGIAALWSALRMRGIWPTVAAALITAASAGGMHYAGMAAMRMSAQPAAMAVQGATAMRFLLPLILVVSIVTFLVAFLIALAPTEDEIREDAALLARIAELERQFGGRPRVLAARRLAPSGNRGQAARPSSRLSRAPGYPSEP
jgi:NO-binding membrane sensor protein with MHYT domain